MTGETHAARYLIRGGRIYDHDGDIHQPAAADLLIRDGIIERIAPQIAADGGVEVVDAAGKLVAPGFVNAHYHSHDVMAKGCSRKCPSTSGCCTPIPRATADGRMRRSAYAR